MVAIKINPPTHTLSLEMDALMGAIERLMVSFLVFSSISMHTDWKVVPTGSLDEAKFLPAIKQMNNFVIRRMGVCVCVCISGCSNFLVLSVSATVSRSIEGTMAPSSRAVVSHWRG